MKKILLIPTYHYLANPVYLSLKSLLKDQFTFTYFFTKDSTHIEGNLKNISEQKVGQYFDEYIEIDYEAPWIRKLENKIVSDKTKSNDIKVKYEGTETIYVASILKKNIAKIKKPLKKFKENIRKIKTLLVLTYALKHYINEFRRCVEGASPDIVVITSDMTMSYRILKKYFPHIPVMVMQPCFLDFRKRKLHKFPLFNKIMNFFLGGIYYPSQPYFGLECENDKLLLFDDDYIEIYKKKRDNIHKIINPFYFKLNQEISSLHRSEVKDTNFQKVKLDKNKKTIILFLSDYVSIYGDEVQEYIERIYIQLIKINNGKYNFIIKNHPRIGVKGFEDNFLECNDICFLDEELTYNEMLSLGDLNISVNSNASLESIVCGMPTVNFLPLGLDLLENTQSLSRYGAINIYTAEEMKAFVKDFSSNFESLRGHVYNNSRKLVGKNDECIERLLNAFNSI